MPQDSPPSTEILRPPRPNLGPEPWSAPPSWPFGWILGGLVVLVGAWLVARRLRKRPNTAAPVPPVLPPVAHPKADTPTDLSAFAGAVRALLATRLDPAWLAKTTPELAADHDLAHRLGRELHRRVVEACSQSDSLNFAQSHPNGEVHLDCDRIWRDLIKRLGAPDGSTSRPTS